ncbi:uncharacterized protein PV07_03906 [Cladophialophora immunda]|uniref:Uncharacterized protein n=1 Tax=Cladophialophora immunda TaxID=569365 RepID=A0A0D2CM93_9EURO|nr:uncharacterized protein PV07_03906 [Cladophialophora immunda]KIW32353.1 hypothetical protein PV07_03906 [Cladophialophora immunda]
MPIPEYDNPPKHLLPLTQTTGPRVKGPRALSPPETKLLNRMRQGFDPLSSTTTIPTDISMGARRLERPLRVAVRPQPPDQWMLNRGQRGFRLKPPPPGDTDIIMNTTTNMNADAIMSIPMPRIRPREMGRPPLLTRAEGMYVVPRMGPPTARSELTDPKLQWLRMPSAVEKIAGEGCLMPETNLMPKPLKPRLQPFQGPITFNDVPPDRTEMSSSDLGLMRRCSHCNHGFVDAKLHNTDSVIPTSAPQKDFDKANVGTKALHPKGSPLPELPQDTAAQENIEIQRKITSHMQQNVDVVDERDHTICCPECCKLDCHEGCLGHPSPTWASNSIENLWSEVPSSTSSSEPETQADIRDKKAQERSKTTRLAAVKTVQKKSHKVEAPKPGNHIQAALSKAASVELTMQPLTSVIDPRCDSIKRLPDAVAAALSAMEAPSQKETKETLAAAFSATGPSQRKGAAARPTMHRRQRSSSLPIIGTGIPLRIGSERARYHRAASGGSRVRVPTPLGSAISCFNSGKDGSTKRRNLSGASVTTIDLQVPSLLSLASCSSYAAIGDVLLIPLEAGKMWVRNHPQVLPLGKKLAQRGWVMAQLMMRTGWRLWAMVFVYSKTGKIKLRLDKGETAGGFVLDVGRSLLYLIVFAALSTLALRLLGLVLGLLGILGWIVRTVFWVLKAILGAGQVK